MDIVCCNIKYYVNNIYYHFIKYKIIDLISAYNYHIYSFNFYFKCKYGYGDG